jgi:hypothetical protein
MHNVSTNNRVRILSDNDKPVGKPVNLDAIPADLKTHDQWCLWKWEHRNDRWTKVP